MPYESYSQKKAREEREKRAKQNRYSQAYGGGGYRSSSNDDDGPDVSGIVSNIINTANDTSSCDTSVPSDAGCGGGGD